MPNVQDLMGLGMSSALAGKIGHTISTTNLPGGATQAAAVMVPSSTAILSPSAGAAIYILSGMASLAKEYLLGNPTAVAATIYPPPGGTINGGAVNAPFTLAANSLCVGVAMTPLTWFIR